MKTFLTKIHTPGWVCLILALVILLRIPSFFEPYSYGDEMIYLTLGQGAKQGATLYKDLHDNKPPLLYLVAGLSGNLFWFKAALALSNLISIILFYKLAEALFPKKNLLIKSAVFIFALATTLPILEGNIANAELFMIGPTIAAFLILLTKTLNFKNLFFAGVLFSIAALFKIPAAFDIPAVIIFWLIRSSSNFKDLKIIAKRTLYLGFGFLFPIILTFIWYFFQGALRDYFVAAFMQNVGYLSSFRPQDVQKPFLIRNAPLLIRAGILAIGVLILFLKRKLLSSKFIFISLWLLFSLFAVTLSERPYPHYLIQSVAPASFFIGILLADKTIEQALAIIPLTLVFFIPVYYKYYYYQIAPYYFRFIRFATGQITTRQYFGEFDGNVNRNYDIANFIARSAKTGEKIFVWGDASPIYALSKHLPPIKYVADYHINDFSSPTDVIGGLARNKPKFIVVLPGTPTFPELSAFIKRFYVRIETVGGATIWLFMPQTGLP